MAFSWRFSHHDPRPSDPASDVAAVTPHDTNDLSIPAKKLRVGTGGAGTLKVDTIEGTAHTFVNVSDGEVFDVIVTRVYATGTTVSNIDAFF